MNIINALSISWFLEQGMCELRDLTRLVFYSSLDTMNIMNYLKFNPEIKLGDLLTILTIMISLFSILYSLKKERNLRRKEQADKVRNAGAKTIAKLDRWRELSLGMFQNFQPIFVEASEKLSQEINPEYPESTRDFFLWKKLDKCKIDTSDKILDENIENAYVDLYGYYPQIRPILEELISLLKKEEELMFGEFLEITQGDIGFFRNKREKFRTAELGNRLRKHARDVHEIYKNKVNNLINPVGDLLFKLISKSDKNLVESRDLMDGLIKYPELDLNAYKNIVAEATAYSSEEDEDGTVQAGVAFQS